MKPLTKLNKSKFSIVNIFFLFYLLLLFYLFFFNNSLVIKIFIILQFFLIMTAYLFKKLFIILFTYFFLLFLQFYLIKNNLILLNEINFSHKEPVFYSSSPILYLYKNKIDPIIINDQSKSAVPLSSLANKYIYMGNFNNKSIVNKTDHIGFFNNLKNNNYKNIFIGDSYIAGSEIDYNKSFVNLLNRNNTIYNFGLPSSGPLTQYAIIKEYKNLPYIKESKNFFWFYSEGNDIARPYVNFEDRGGDINIEKSLTLLINYLTNDNFNQNLIEYNKIIQKNFLKNSEKIKKTEDFKYILFPIFKYVIKKVRNKTTEINKNLVRNYEEDKTYYNNNLEVYFSVVKKMKKMLKENDKNLTIIFTPNNFNCLINKDHFLNLKIKQKLREFEIDYLDMGDAFKVKKNCNTNNFNDSGHFSEEGHSNIAIFLEKEINFK